MMITKVVWDISQRNRSPHCRCVQKLWTVLDIVFSAFFEEDKTVKDLAQTVIGPLCAWELIGFSSL